MLVTQTTLVGFTLINGTIALQFALLMGALYNLFLYPEVAGSTYLKLSADH